MAESIIGKRIVLKSNSEIRYIGTLYAIDRESSAISLVDVLSLGTEDRVTPGGFVPPANTVYPYVVFRAADVRDIAVIDEPGQGVQPPQPQLPHDPAIVSQGSAPAPPMTQAQSSPFPPNQSAAQHMPSPHASSAPIVPPPATMAPPIAPSVATAHTTTLERVQNDFSKRPPLPASSSPAVPSRQPTGPAVGIPFEQLAAQVDHRGPPARGPGRVPHHSGTGRGGGGRTGGASRGPGAFSLAAQGDDLKAEFDFEGMNARFAALRSGEKGTGGEEGAPPPPPPSQGAAGEKNVPTGNADQRPAPAAETVPSSSNEKNDDKTTDNAPKAPAYNKSSSFFDSVSSNIQNPQQGGASRGGRGRGGGGGGFTSSAGNRGRGPRTHDQPFTSGGGGSLPVDGGQPRGSRREGASAFPLPPRPPRGGGAGRFNNRRREEAALNEMTFGGDDDAPAPTTTTMDGGRGGRARGRGNGRPATAAATSFE